MKKLLLSFAVMAFAVIANATVVTFDFVNNDYGLERKSGTASDGYLEDGQQITLDGATLTFYGGWRLWTDGLREYSSKSPSFTVSATEEVTGVSWTVVSGATFALEGTTANITSWTGSESSVTFVGTASANKAVKTITVTFGEAAPEQPEEPEPEQPETPTETITVAQAIALINDGFTGEATVSGVISEVGQFNSTYGQVTYWLVDEGSTDALQVYSGFYLNGEKFTSASQIAVGGKVVVKGNLKNYNGTPEMDMRSVMLSYEAPEGGDTPEQPEEPLVTMTVAEALAKMAEGFEGNASVKGIISDIKEVSTSYGNAEYTIKDALTDAEGLLVYRGYWLNGDKFTDANQIAVGGTVVVEGKLVNYNGTYEFTSGSKIVEYTAPEGGDTPVQPEPTEPTGDNVTFDFSDPTAYGFTVEDGATEITLTDETLESGVISIECTAEEGASNPPRFFCSAAGVWTFRFYKGSTIYVNAEDGYKITAIVFNGTNLNKNITYTEGALVGTTWTATNAEGVESMSFTKTATGDNPAVSTMTVYYNNGNAGGVDNVATELNAPVEYFNLQGVRVANPENGLYIRRQGNTATKVLVK